MNSTCVTHSVETSGLGVRATDRTESARQTD